MATIEVEVVATETIRPSSPTPPHLKTFLLSGLDQFAPLLKEPLFLCYTNDDKQYQNHQKRIHCLKQSLAKTLTHIYPLAGRVCDNQYISCKDQGINFFEARVHGDDLSQFLSRTHDRPDDLEKLIPKDHLLVLAGSKEDLLSIQVNCFECGGMVIAFLISHKLADAFSVYIFLKYWAIIARDGGDDQVIHQYQPYKLGTTSTFPPNNMPAAVPPVDPNTVTKRFVFNPVNLAALTTNLFTKPPSRALAVTALIWKCVMRAGIDSVATLAVNLRQKEQLPHLSQTSLGNCYVSTTTTPTEDTHLELDDLVDKLREAVTRVDSDYVKQLKLGDSLFFQPFQQVNELCSKGELERYSFSILCNFPFYETDFGWGKPIWVTTTAVVGYKNVVMLMDTKCGTGVEAWITLDEESMARFEGHPHLVAFTSPSIITLRSNM